MGRLARFGDYRYIGNRKNMRFYDTDQPDQSDYLAELIKSEQLLDQNQLQAFAPDEPEEARNRGFRSARKLLR